MVKGSVYGETSLALSGQSVEKQCIAEALLFSCGVALPHRLPACRLAKGPAWVIKGFPKGHAAWRAQQWAWG